VDYAQGSGIANPSPFSEILALETRQHVKADTSCRLQVTSE
jgi:hypothetical protein